MANLRVTVLVHEDHPLEFRDGQSATPIGTIVDRHISSHIQHGQEVMEVCLHFSVEEQADLRAAYQGEPPMFPDDGNGAHAAGSHVQKAMKNSKKAY